jgi:hypothetical protein
VAPGNPWLGALLPYAAPSPADAGTQFPGGCHPWQPPGANRGKLVHFERSLAVNLVQEAEGGTARFADCPITTGEPERPELGKAAPSASRNQ